MSRIFKIYISVLWFSVTILLLCCTQKSDTGDQLNSTEISTISTYIEEGRDSDLLIDERKLRLDKAYKSIALIADDSIKTRFFSKLSLAYLKLKDSLKFRDTNSKTLDLATKTKDSTTLAEANWDLAEFYKSYAVADSAYFRYLEAKNIYEKLENDIYLGTMLNNMAIVQAEVKDYTGSEITTIQAIELFKSLKDNSQLFKAYSVLGTISKELKEYDRALSYYNIALEYQKKIGYENNFAVDLKHNIGVVYQDQGNYDASITYFKETLENENLLKEDPRFYAMVLNNLTYSQSKKNPNVDVSEQFKKAIQIQDSIGDISGISRTYYCFAEFYFDKNDTVNALIQAKKSQDYAELANNNQRVLETLQLLTKVNPQNSSVYNQNYIKLNDSLQEQERQVRDKFARIRFETDEYIAENESLASEKQLWTGISFAVFLLGASAFVILNQRSKNQKLRFQQEQQATNQEIFNLMLAQKQKEEEGKKSEQKRISEELHDGVLGKMMGSRLVLTGLNQKDEKEAKEQRKNAIDALQEVEKEIRAISHELSHNAYEKINNFILSVQDLLISVEQTSNIACNLVYDREWEWDYLQGDIKINTYRIIQESVQNAIKHAKCNNITITFIAKKSNIDIRISDDGSGFRKIRSKRGIGMRNIASRMENLKGKWHIDSVQGKGTTIHLQIPVSSTEDNISQIASKSEVLSET